MSRRGEEGKDAVLGPFGGGGQQPRLGQRAKDKQGHPEARTRRPCSRARDRLIKR